MSEKNPLENPNVQKFLDFLGKAEGADYDVIVGGKKFNDFSKHPRIVGLRTKEGPSTAAGKYQITKTTYDDFAPKLGITDFSPRSQDRIAVAIFQKEKALSDIERGDFNAAISKLGRRFASLPSSPYSQPKRSQKFVDMQLGVVGLASAEPSKMQRTAASAKKPQFDVAAGPKKAPAKGKLALSDLPETYRSALALNFLVDSDPEDELMAKATQLLQASMPEQGGGPAGGKVLQQYAAQMPEVSPYQFLQPSPPDPGPTKMATGGLAIGGTRVPFVPNPSLTKEQMDLIKQREQDYETYQQRFKDYETSFSEYERQAAAYDAAIDEHNRTLTSEFTMQAPVAPTAPDVGFDTAEYEKTIEQAQKDAALRSQALGVALDPKRFNLAGLAMFREGGEVLGKEPEDKAKKEALQMLLNLQQQVGPVSGQFVPSAQGLDIRARTDVLGLRPFVDIDPREQRISQYGASYGGATPQGQYDVTVSRRTPMQTPMGPMEMPVVAQGMYRAPIGKAGELSAQGFYVPEQGQMSRPAYGANLMYRQRFANGGEVTGDDLFQQMITGQAVEPVYEAPPPKVNYSQAVPGSEVPVIDRLTGRVMRDEPQPEFRGTVLQEIVGAGEAAAAVGTGITSLVPGAGRIIKGLLTPGETAEQTQKAASQTMQDFTYLPKGKAGQRNIMDLQDVIPKELTGAMPQVQLMRPLLAPGAAGILRQRAKDAMDVRGGPGGAPPMSGMGLQPAMAAVGQGPVDRTAADRPLVRPAEGVAGPSITQAVRPGGGEAIAPSTPTSLIGGDFQQKYLTDLETDLDVTSGTPNFKAINDKTTFLGFPLREKVEKYFTTQYGTPSDPLYKAFREGRYDLNPLFRQKLSDTETDRTAKAIQDLRDKEAALLAEPRTPENVALLSQVDRKLSAHYDYFTPMDANIGYKSIGVRLSDDAYRADLADRLAEETGRRSEFNDMSYTKIVDVLDNELKNLAEKIKQVPESGSLDQTDVEKMLGPYVNVNNLNYAVSQQLLAEMDGKVSAQGGMLTRNPKIDIGTSLVTEEGEARGQPTFYPTSKTGAVLEDELYTYLKHAPLEEIQGRTFPELVIAARNSDTWKQIKDPVKIALRADGYLALTPEQRFTGTKMVDFDGNQTARNALLSRMKESDIKGAHWREITDPGGIKIEGRLLRHCLSRYPEETSQYENKLTSGLSRYFVLRDKKGMGYASIEVEQYGMKGPFSVIKQIKGRQNQSVAEKYGKEVTAFLQEYEKTQPRPLTFTEFKRFVPEEYVDRAIENNSGWDAAEI
jgi:muramidase (phage lysozyme)